MPINRRILSQDAAVAAGDADQVEGLVLHLDANDEDSIENGGANTGAGSGTWFDIANHDLNVPLVDKASNLQLHLNASDTTSYGGSGNDWTDISQNSNTATDTSPTFSSDTRGYFVMDGSNDYFTISYNASLYMTSNTGFTIEAWVNRDDDGEAYIIASDDNSSYPYALSWNTATHGYYGWISGSGYDAGTVVGTSETSTNGVGEWDHVVMTQSSSDRKNRLYVNGTLTSTSSGAASGFHSTSSDVYVGTYHDQTSKFDGKMSVIRIYNAALTASEVAQNFRADCFLSYSSIYSTNLQLHLDAGDETTVSASTWSDKANSNNGTLTGFSSTLSDFYDKELGNWLEFDGTDDKVTNSDCNLDSANISITAWVFLDHYGTGDGTSIVHLGSGSTAGTSILFRERSNGKLSVYDFGAANLDTDNVELSLSTWHYVALTVSGTTYKLYVDGVEKKSGTETAYSGDDRLIIGNYNNVSSGASSQFWDGKMGVVKLYNVALTPAQVAQNYLATKNDYPNGHNGTISGADFDTNTGSPNESYFDFSGATSDLITIADDSIFDFTANTSMEVWLTKGTTNHHIINKKDGASQESWAFWTNGSVFYFYPYNTSNVAPNIVTSSTLNATWNHIVVTVGTSLDFELYLNGSSEDTGTVSGTMKTDSATVKIGSYNGSFAYAGKIAMVKFFAKELSASEVLANYNATKATFGL